MASEPAPQTVADIRPRIRADAYLRDAGLPSPAKPGSDGKDYAFPHDVSRLSSAELGNLRLKLSALHGYATRLLAQEESSLVPLDTVYKLRLDVAVGKLSGRYDKRPPAVEVLRAMAIDDDPTLAGTTQALIEKHAITRRLEAQIKIYENHLGALSREQARQEMLAKNFA